MIGEIASSLLPSRYFYDTNYHLSTEGAKVFTEIFPDNYFHNTYYFGKR